MFALMAVTAAAWIVLTLGYLLITAWPWSLAGLGIGAATVWGAAKVK